MNQTRDILLVRSEAVPDLLTALRPKERMDLNKPKPKYEVEEYEDEGGFKAYRLAVVRASGVLARDVEGWIGCCDLGRIADEVEDANEDENIEGIVLVIDSPGGTVNGTPEAAARIAGVDKPLMVWTEGELCSAAYWLAASADYIAAAPSATTGSIGCVLAVYDISAMYGAMGIQVNVFRSGELKASGFPGTELSPVEAERFQSQVDDIGFEFASWVLNYRPEIDPMLFDGRSVSGKEAFAAGAVDALHNTKEEAIAQFLALFGD